MTIGVTYSFRGSCDSEKSFVMLGNLHDLLLFWLFGGLVIRNCQASLDVEKIVEVAKLKASTWLCVRLSDFRYAVSYSLINPAACLGASESYGK